MCSETRHLDFATDPAVRSRSSPAVRFRSLSEQNHTYPWGGVRAGMQGVFRFTLGLVGYSPLPCRGS